jgi:hypothetical protein
MIGILTLIYDGFSAWPGRAVKKGDELVIGSQMPTSGVIFSDGVESDFLESNSGSVARFTVSKQRARLVAG